eukprot:jgi/Botrbrau1/19588/Bobra.0035s0070.2
MADHVQSQWGKELGRGNVMPETVAVDSQVTESFDRPRCQGGQQDEAASTSGVAANLPERLRSTEKPDSLESLKLLVAGGFAGAISKTATAPLARLTILYQVQGLASAQTALGSKAVSQKLSVNQAFSQIIRQEGLRALWKGNGVTIVHRLPYSAVNFWSYEHCSEWWARRYPPSKDNPSHDVVRRLICGGLAGMLACTVAYPLDLVRTRFAAQTTKRYYLGINHALRTIVQEEGPRGLYRGLGATLCQVAPSLAINYTAYGTLRSKWMEGEGRSKKMGTVRFPKKRGTTMFAEYW